MRSTRCEKSAVACFAFAGLRGASFLRRTSPTTKSTNGTISAFTGRSCAMRLAAWADTGPSAGGQGSPTGAVSGPSAAVRCLLYWNLTCTATW